MIKTIIVEDEQSSLIRLKQILSNEFSDIEIVAECSTVKAAIEKITLLQPDLVFLDVQLDIKDGGIIVLNETRSVKYEVVFTTAYGDYATKAFDFCALHYLLKPYDVEDLQKALNRYKEKNESSGTNIEVLLDNAKPFDNIQLQKIGIPVLKGIDFISISDIIYCKAVDNCTDFYLTNKRKTKATKTLKWFNEMLFEYRFFRSHASYFINLDHIVRYRKQSFTVRKDGDDGEGGTIELSEQMEAPLSRRKREEFLKIFRNKK